MKEKLITVTRDELEQIILDETLKARHMLFDIEIEDYFEPPKPKESRFYKNSVLIKKAEWDNLLKQMEYILTDFQQARDIIKIMEPVYKQYHIQYEQSYPDQKPEMSESDYFDKYIKMMTTSYDSDEFERTRELFEGIFPASLDDELEY